jgi:retron-type reverse transcriptase
MRISGLANDFQKGKNINFESNDPASRQKISPQKGVSRRFRASRTAERPEYEKQSVEMKRIGNLYEKIISLDNLRLADEKARRGKLRSYGVLLHDKNREANILALHETLKNHTFKNSEYSTFTIYEPKERIIFRLPYYPDRILHHAIMNILEPIWVSVFTKDTYSCIKGRGIHGAMRNVKRAIKDRENARYCLKIDIRKFYPSIDHDVLKTIIRRKIKCKDTLALLDTIIDSTDGVPIGNYLSQYFANLMLAYFDHWIKEEVGVKYYFRYADDMVFLHKDKAFLHDLLTQIDAYLRDNLHLTIKANYQVFPIAKNRSDKHGRGLDFVGFVFYHEHKLIRKSIKKNFCRAVARLNKQPNLSAKDYKQGVCSWLGWAKHSNSKHLLKTIIKPSFYGNL